MRGKRALTGIAVRGKMSAGRECGAVRERGVVKVTESSVRQRGSVRHREHCTCSSAASQSHSSSKFPRNCKHKSQHAHSTSVGCVLPPRTRWLANSGRRGPLEKLPLRRSADGRTWWQLANSRGKAPWSLLTSVERVNELSRSISFSLRFVPGAVFVFY